MIAGFDAWVIWMKIWETKSINIPFMQAYWARDEKKLLTMDMADQFKDYKKWDDVMTAYWPIKVFKITKEKITFDTNHSLAGKDLIFDITIKDIK
jgi:FKBP-type peptidyl-prolyl cis-trans isomerase 2